MNADVLCSYPLRDLLLAHLKRGREGHEGDPSPSLLGAFSEPSRHGREGTLLTTRSEEPSEYGVVVVDERTGGVTPTSWIVLAQDLS